MLASWGEGPESWWLVMAVKSVWLHSEALFRIRQQSLLLLENEAFSRPFCSD